MNLVLGKVLGEGIVRKTAALHKEHLESLPEFVGGKGDDTHEEKDTVKDGDGDHAQDVEGKHRGKDQ